MNMTHPINLIQSVLTVGLWIFVAGCGQISRQEQDTVRSDTLITADCIVNYFQKDSAPYITQQQHRFDPSSGYLEIIANEPAGQYTFTLTKENFTSGKQLTPFLSGLPASFVNQPLATALFYSFTAGAGLLDTTSFTILDATKIEGQWYQPVQVTQTKDDLQITLMRNSQTNRIELVQVQMGESEIQWIIRSYNLRYSKELDTLVPMKIDVFDIRGGIASKKLLIQFDYKRILKN